MGPLHLIAKIALVVLAACIVPHSVLAEVYPARQITMVVGFSAGGPSDTIARVLAERLRQSLGEPVIVENVTGASGSTAVGRVVRLPRLTATPSISAFSALTS